MSTIIPVVLQPMLNEYQITLKNTFRNKIFGVYLYNSVALGGFDKNKSDIDFITIINEKFTNNDFEKLSYIHNDFNERYNYAKKMEGMYTLKDDIGKLNSDIDPYLYFCDGILHSYGYYDINYVTWWTLKNNGIPVNSPSIDNLNIDVNFDNILFDMDYNINVYWKDKLGKDDMFFSDEDIEFTCLTLCRIVYTLNMKKIATKIEGANFVLDIIPEEYKNIIMESINIRKNPNNRSLYKNKFDRKREMQSFLRHIIDYCNNNFINVMTQNNV